MIRIKFAGQFVLPLVALCGANKEVEMGEINEWTESVYDVWLISVERF